MSLSQVKLQQQKLTEIVALVTDNSLLYKQITDAISNNERLIAILEARKAAEDRRQAELDKAASRLNALDADIKELVKNQMGLCDARCGVCKLCQYDYLIEKGVSKEDTKMVLSL